MAEDPKARERLERGLDELGWVAERGQIAQLLRLTEMLESWGKRVNLTGHQGQAEIVSRLLLEAVGLLAAAPAFESLADLGSGAGFPGLPVAILLPGVQVTLVDARKRRHHFQKAAIRELGLQNVRPELGRAEELAAVEHHAVVAQAMAKPDQAVVWMLPWARRGGWLLVPGAEDPPQIEMNTEFRFETVKRYQLAGNGPARTLWIGQKV
jgi:16S rRNA (guanine527-N7)-methyltransferase